jgi:hypothetical protein
LHHSIAQAERGGETVIAINPEGGAEERHRTNLFIAATLYTDGAGSVPVKVRNLSPGGAMIEGTQMPTSGAPIRLERGPLAVAGAVVWSAHRRCGLAFAHSVSVKEWMSPPQSPALRQRQAAEAAEQLLGTAFPVSPSPSAEALSADLQQAARLVEQLGDVLAADPDLLGRHQAELQSVDIVLQMLDAAAGLLQDRPGSERRMANLRRTAAEALRSPAG